MTRNRSFMADFSPFW